MKPTDFDSNLEWIKHCIKEMEGSTDVEYIIIKGHIFSEFLLNSFLERVNDKIKYKDLFRQYSQKLAIFQMLAASDDLMDKLNKLNSLRNNLAHTMTISKNALGVFHSIATLNNHQKSLLPKLIVPSKEKKYKTISAMVNILKLMYYEMDLYFDMERIKTNAWLKQRSNQIKERRKEIVKKPQEVNLFDIIPIPLWDVLNPSI